MSSKEILINTTLDKIRHFLQKDGGDVEFIKYEKHVVYVNMKGACEGCSYAYADIKDLIEVILQEEVDPKIEVRLASELEIQ
ncbi:MAG: NifU family protein [Bacilli bacterium]|nr:NifU family protein [Bacilli bacterium]